ncbi:uncharacterized protein LOC119725804 [Patiria miniata]|uniref:TRADD-like N-terminal domain-containing protein n=1 Tax=Patiria miniata TaxID=46514 RepID=A0A913ZQE5_PATMI|nr:uncharacterized protein LOC119725804 [Patiria miniata]
MGQVVAYLRRLIFQGEYEQRSEANEPCRKRACSDDLRGDYGQETSDKSRGDYGQETSDKSSDQLPGSPRVPYNKKAKHDAPAGQDQDSSSDTSDSSSDTPQQSGNERGEASKIRNEDNPRRTAGKRSSKRSRLRNPERGTSTEIQEPGDTETIIHYKCNNFYLIQSPLTLGDSTGNAYNYDVSAKFYGIKEGRRDEGQTRSLLEIIRKLVEANEPEVTSLKDICRECDAATIGVEKGCVKVTFRFNSKEGLQRFWAKYSSGELQQRLKADLPIGKVEMSADDYARGCEFFEGSGRRSRKVPESRDPDLTASLDTVEYYIAEYVRHRNATLKLLRAWTQDYANPWKRITKIFSLTSAALYVMHVENKAASKSTV